MYVQFNCYCIEKISLVLYLKQKENAEIHLNTRRISVRVLKHVREGQPEIDCMDDGTRLDHQQRCFCLTDTKYVLK